MKCGRGLLYMRSSRFSFTSKNSQNVNVTYPCFGYLSRAGLSQLEGEGGARGMCPPLLSDQLTLSQREWENYAHNIIMCPSDFQTFLRPCGVFKNNSICGHDCDNFVPIDEVQTGPLAFEFNYLFVGYCCKRSKNCGVSNNLVAIIWLPQVNRVKWTTKNWRCQWPSLVCNTDNLALMLELEAGLSPAGGLGGGFSPPSFWPIS